MLSPIRPFFIGSHSALNRFIQPSLYSSSRLFFSMSAPSSFYDFKVKDLRGKDYDLSALKNKVVVVVNTATKCGLAPQFAGLDKLYQKYKDDGLVVLGFPSTTFHQESDNNEEVATVCQRNFGVTFPIMEIVDVNGPNAHPVYEYIKAEKTWGFVFKRIRWNFEKFIIGKDGKVVSRYAPISTPESMENEIKSLLGK